MDKDLLLVLLAVAGLSARVGFCLYHTGLSQSKNAAAAVTRSLADFCVALLAFWAVGYAILMRSPGLLLGRHDQFQAWGLFAAVLASTASGAALGGTLERTRLLPSLFVSAILAGGIVPLSLRWAWSGWLHGRLGFFDVGGASFIHLTGGLCAAAAAILSGPRQGKYNHDGSANHIPGHNIPLAAAGTLGILAGLLFLLMGLSSQRPDPEPVKTAMEGLLAAAAGGAAALAVARIRFAITDFHLISTGLLAGVVSISAGAGHMSGFTSVVVGAAGGALAAGASAWIDLKWRIDDPAGAISIHAVGGVWSLLIASLNYAPPPFLAELAGIAAIGGMSLAAALAVYALFGWTSGLRPGAADELDGLDLVDHDLNAYPDFQQPTIKSHHLRQM